MNTKDILLEKIPEDVHRKFKTGCTSKGKSMREVLIDFMRKFGTRKHPGSAEAK